MEYLKYSDVFLNPDVSGPVLGSLNPGFWNSNPDYIFLKFLKLINFNY